MWTTDDAKATFRQYAEMRGSVYTDEVILYIYFLSLASNIH
jgi:hypothetical protein